MVHRLNFNGRQFTLGNGIIEVIYSGVEGRYDIVNRSGGTRVLAGAVAQAVLANGERLEFVGDENGRETEIQDAVGRGRQLELIGTKGDRGIVVGLRVRCYDGRPGCLLQAFCRNDRPEPVRVARLVPLSVDGAEYGRVGLPVPQCSSAPFPSAGVWTNGWQSWSPAAAHTLRDRDSSSLIKSQRTMHTNPTTSAYRMARTYIGEWVAALVDRASDECLAFGFATMADYLSQVEIRAGRSWRIEASCDCEGAELLPGGTLASEWLYVDHGRGLAAVLARYADAAGRLMGARLKATAPIIWSPCQGAGKVGEADLVAALERLRALRDTVPIGSVQLVEVGDGYQVAAGDWTECNGAFPHGMKWLADRIHEAGFKAGLWLAPFAVLQTSRLFQDHPDWLLRDGEGRVVSGGRHPDWNDELYGLDVTHPEVGEWLRGLFRTVVEEWGYDYVKLDLLYCAALPGRHHDQAATRAQALRRGLEIIRATVGDRLMMAGGCPLGPAIGVVDGMRVGPDAAPRWLARRLSWERSQPSARNALRNILNRAFMHGRFWFNDPGCLFISARDGRLTPDELSTLAAAVGLTGGALTLGGQLQGLGRADLRLISRATPRTGDAALAVDVGTVDTPTVCVLAAEREWGKWMVAGFFNWGEATADRLYTFARLGLDPDCEYHLYDFWSGRYLGRRRGTLAVRGIPAHGCRLYRLTPVEAGPTIVGTTFHVTQGLNEIERVSMVDGILTIELGPHAEGAIACWFPGDGDGKVVTVEVAAGGPMTVRVAPPSPAAR